MCEKVIKKCIQLRGFPCYILAPTNIFAFKNIYGRIFISIICPLHMTNLILDFTVESLEILGFCTQIIGYFVY